MSTFTGVSEEDVKKLEESGFDRVDTKSEYENARLKSDNATLVFYDSGKLVVQGRKDVVDDATRLIEDLGIGDTESEWVGEEGVIIGSDETLKGDTFGGLIVAGVKADEDTRERLKDIGVRDSKLLSDEDVKSLVSEINSVADSVVKKVSPEQYNHNLGAVTALLDELHGECHEDLKPGKHVVDEYPGCSVGDIVEQGADSKYVEVAAASILARAGALEQFEKLSEKAGFDLPLGSTHVSEALERLSSEGFDLKEFAKTDFRNVQEYLD